MNNFFKKIILLFLIFSLQCSYVFAENNNVEQLWETGSIDNIRFEKEAENGKVFVDNKLIFNGLNGEKIEGVVFSRVGKDFIYLNICSSTCSEFIINNNNNNIGIETSLKIFPYLIKRIDGYIGILSSFPDSDEIGVTLFSVDDMKILGTRYFRGVKDIDDFSLDKDNIVLLKNGKAIKKISIHSFSKESVHNDYKKYENIDQIKYFLNKYSQYFIGIIVFVLLILFLKKQKTTQ